MKDLEPRFMVILDELLEQKREILGRIIVCQNIDDKEMVKHYENNLDNIVHLICSI